ncbi:MAG: MMPL family transporter, partial [Acidimicrobiales bacterium]
MLSALARLATRRPKRVVVFAIIAFGVCGVLGGPAAGLLSAKNPFNNPSSESSRAEALIQKATGQETSPGVLAYVPAPPSSSEVAHVASLLAHVPGVAKALTPPVGVHSPLVSSDGSASMVAVYMADGASQSKTVSKIDHAVKHAHLPGVLLGGQDVANVQVGDQAVKDLGMAELLAFPLLALIALFVFRGFSALLPLATGGLAVFATFLVLRVINEFFPLSTFALNLVIGLGLGLAVDYSLFMVWRFREYLQKGMDPAAALHATMVKTGRTVVFSALTVAAALATLTIFPLRFLVSMGIGGAVVAVIAAASALVMLPSLMFLMARRIGKTKVKEGEKGFWYRLSHGVMKQPALIAIGTIAVLVLLAWPTPSIRWSGIDASVLPTSQSARVVNDIVDSKFPQLHGGDPILVAAVVPDGGVVGSSGGGSGQLAAYASRLKALPGVASVAGPTRLAGDVWEISVGTPYSGISSAGQQLVRVVRDTPSPDPVLVGGAAADTLDLRNSIADNVPIALIILCALTMIVLWMMTGSVILPIKALVMNGLTAFAATGILVFVFQGGRFTGLLSYTSQGGIEETDFLILVAVAFALSTDYGVFLLARIREARATAPSEREAIASGLASMGRLVT